MNAIGRITIALCTLLTLCTGVVARPVFGIHFPDGTPLPNHYYSATIRCLVKHEDGKPFQGASVQVDCTHYYNIPKGYEILNDAMGYFTDTDKQGKYEFREQLPGTYTVGADYDNYVPASQTVKVVPNRVTTVTLILHKRHRKAVTKAA